MLIMLDPGHGGKDPGAIGPTGLKESDVTLLLSLMTKDKLEKVGLRVYLTRYADDTVPLERRAMQANIYGADYFISLHCNAAENPEAHGTEAFAYHNSGEGRILAECIHGAIVEKTKLTARGVKYANFAVLRETRMPAALVEVAFISNQEEEKLLKDVDWLSNVSEAIVEGLQKALKYDIMRGKKK